MQYEVTRETDSLRTWVYSILTERVERLQKQMNYTVFRSMYGWVQMFFQLLRFISCLFDIPMDVLYKWALTIFTIFAFSLMEIKQKCGIVVNLQSCDTWLAYKKVQYVKNKTLWGVLLHGNSSMTDWCYATWCEVKLLLASWSWFLSYNSVSWSVLILLYRRKCNINAYFKRVSENADIVDLNW